MFGVIHVCQELIERHLKDWIYSREVSSLEKEETVSENRRSWRLAYVKKRMGERGREGER